MTHAKLPRSKQRKPPKKRIKSILILMPVKSKEKVRFSNKINLASTSNSLKKVDPLSFIFLRLFHDPRAPLKIDNYYSVPGSYFFPPKCWEGMKEG